MQPEIVVLAAGGTALAGGYRRENGWPKNGTKGVLGTLALVVVFSFLGQTKIKPIVSGFAWLLLLAAIIVTVPAFTAKPTNNQSKTRTR